jgi:hypothetical protein
MLAKKGKMSWGVSFTNCVQTEAKSAMPSLNGFKNSNS